MTAIPHGERPLWLIVAVGVLIVAGIVGPWLAGTIAERHERSVKRHRNVKGRQDW